MVSLLQRNVRPGLSFRLFFHSKLQCLISLGYWAPAMRYLFVGGILGKCVANQNCLLYDKFLLELCSSHQHSLASHLCSIKGCLTFGVVLLTFLCWFPSSSSGFLEVDLNRPDFWIGFDLEDPNPVAPRPASWPRLLDFLFRDILISRQCNFPGKKDNDYIL